ncbi:MAG: hypothetical protein ACP5UT_00310 [Bryobacteraceae bacterium]
MIRFLFGRFMYQRWRTILMQDGLGVRQTPSVFPPGIDFRFHACHQNLPEAVRAQIYRAGGASSCPNSKTTTAYGCC